MSHKVGQSILVIVFEIICAHCVKMVLSKIFLCEKNVKYKGEIFESSDLTHIHRDEWGHSGNASRQIWMESMDIHNSYKWPKVTFQWKITKYKEEVIFFNSSDFAHIHRVARAHSGSDSNQVLMESMVIGWSYKRPKVTLFSWKTIH